MLRPSLLATTRKHLYNKEKTCFFVRPSVCLSTFLILSYFSKSIIVTQKIIIELRLKNSKEGNWKGKNVDKIKELFLNEEIHFYHFLSAVAMVTRLKKWLNLAQVLAKLLFIKFFY